MHVVAFHWKSGVNPVLFPTGIVEDIRITQRRQFTGSVFGSVSRGTGAIHDDLRTLVRQDLCS